MDEKTPTQLDRIESLLNRLVATLDKFEPVLNRFAGGTGAIIGKIVDFRRPREGKQS